MEVRLTTSDTTTGISPGVTSRPVSSEDMMVWIEGLHDLCTSLGDHIEDVQRSTAFHYSKIACTTIALATLVLQMTWDHTGSFQGISTVVSYTALAVWLFSLHQPISRMTSVFVQVLQSIAVVLGRICNESGVTCTFLKLAWVTCYTLQYTVWTSWYILLHMALPIALYVYVLLPHLVLVAWHVLSALPMAVSEFHRWIQAMVPTTWSVLSAIIADVKEFYFDFHSGLWLNMGPPLVIRREEWEAACAKFANRGKEWRKTHHENRIGARRDDLQDAWRREGRRVCEEDRSAAARMNRYERVREERKRASDQSLLAARRIGLDDEYREWSKSYDRSQVIATTSSESDFETEVGDDCDEYLDHDSEQHESDIAEFDRGCTSEDYESDDECETGDEVESDDEDTLGMEYGNEGIYNSEGQLDADNEALLRIHVNLFLLSTAAVAVSPHQMTKMINWAREIHVSTWRQDGSGSNRTCMQHLLSSCRNQFHHDNQRLIVAMRGHMCCWGRGDNDAVSLFFEASQIDRGNPSLDMCMLWKLNTT
nr:hypothetical protein CFP56_10342 [Quercus suber]